MFGGCLLHTHDLINNHNTLRTLSVHTRTLSASLRDTMFNGYWKHAAIGLTEEPAGQEPQVWAAAASTPARRSLRANQRRSVHSVYCVTLLTTAPVPHLASPPSFRTPLP